MIHKETEKKLDEYEELLFMQKEAIEKLIKNLIKQRQSNLDL